MTFRRFLIGLALWETVALVSVAIVLLVGGEVQNLIWTQGGPLGWSIGYAAYRMAGGRPLALPPSPRTHCHVYEAWGRPRCPVCTYPIGSVAHSTFCAPRP